MTGVKGVLTPARLGAALALLLVLAGCVEPLKPLQTYQPGRRVHLGLRLKVVDAGPYLKDTDLTGPNGLLVMAVKPESPAAAAGVAPGDLLLRLNGQRVTGMRESLRAAQALKPGDLVSFQVMRGREIFDYSTLLHGGMTRP